MKRLLLFSLVFLFVFSLSAQNDTQIAETSKPSKTSYVNPFVGTDFHGHTFPGAAWPFGMMQLSPDTRLDTWDGCSGYHYSDSLIYGFSHTHLSGTGCSDYGDILLMPVTDYPSDIIDKEIYRSEFCHCKEEAHPGYYRVFLDKWGVNAELTVGRRAGMHRYSYPSGSKAQLIIDLQHRDIVLDSRLVQKGPRAIEGFRRSEAWAKDQMCCFYLETSADIESVKIENNRLALITFKTPEAPELFQVVVRIGISSVSEENARVNLYAGVKGFDFDALSHKADRAWNKFLGKIEVESPYQGDVKTFYTALYHSALAPCLYSDEDGRYRGMDRQIHTAKDREQYTVFSLWDTYRCLHPLLCILEKERTQDFIKSFLSIYEEGGKLPVWELAANETNCMIGYHSIPVIADAWAKGIRGFDTEKALKAMLHSANQDAFGISLYRDNGLVPAEQEHESVSKTLEYAFDDACISWFAKSLGKQDIAETYALRAQYYKNQFDPQTGLMRPKLQGRWLSPFNPTEVNVHFTEANSWQYSFYVPQDVNTHMEMLGGEQAYIEKLDQLFSASNKTTGRTQVDITGLIGQYAHGNEPSHHTAYLYAYAGAPWKTQEKVREILRSLYSSEADGLCGNDDCGQMSAWYVFSALGFYPLAPGTDVYVMGAPLFQKAIIHPDGGKDFEIFAPNAPDNLYVQSLSFNSTPYTKTWFTHKMLMDGGKMNYIMGDRPNTDYGKAIADRPVSRIDGKQIVTNPWFQMENTMMQDSMQVSLHCATPNASIYYSIENGPRQVYQSPFWISKACHINARSFADADSSAIVSTTLHKVSRNYTIRLEQSYNPQYNAGGDEGLIDGVRGALNFRLGGWQGYQSADFTAVLDCGKRKDIHRIAAGFLQDAKSWIWMPQYVEFFVSNNGKRYKSLGRLYPGVEPQDYEIQIKDLIWEGSESARYIKVFAKNFGTIPAWHLGVGGEGFIFIDEISVE